MRRVKRFYRLFWSRFTKILSNRERGQIRLLWIITGVLTVFILLSVQFFKTGRAVERKLWYANPLGHTKKYYQARWEFYLQARSISGPQGDTILLEPGPEIIKVFIDDLEGGSHHEKEIRSNIRDNKIAE